MKRVVIIGGGASGLVTAINAKTKNNEVIILEQNSECGKKILATGNGKCNYFNENQNLNNYNSTNKEDIKKFITDENLSKTISFFDSLALVPKIKAGYFYPASEQASSIRNILVNKVKELGIEIKYNFKVENIVLENDKFIISSDSQKIISDIVVLATGSYAAVKNKKEVVGYDILKSFDLRLEKVLPSLVQLKSSGNFLKLWNGVRCDVNLKLYEDNIKIKEESGQIQLTDYGISGICTFNISGCVAKGLATNKQEVVVIDFLPNIDKDINNFINFLEERNNLLNNPKLPILFEGVLNSKLIAAILKYSNISSNKTFLDLTDKEKNILVKNIKEFRLKITGTNNYDKAQTCSGGLSLDEVNLKTMEVKKVKNLYVVGELLDIDGLCGGYNLTIAWISSILAGSDIHD